MAGFQTGVLSASVGVRGNGSKGVEVWRLSGCLGLELPVMLRVCMVRGGCGGGEFGIGEVDVGVGCGETGY